jgi:hypothetical protein
MIFNKSVFAVIFLIALSSCSTTKPIATDCNCDLKPDKGNCRAMITKYYFDKEEGRCKEFSWGGCNGTVPFETLEACNECECNK